MAEELCTAVAEQISIPSFGFGTAGLGSAVFASVIYALQFTPHIDTAIAPGWYNEKEVGNAITSYCSADETESDGGVDGFSRR
jgi:diketogulonate reductase-like aldo/keto reductase